MNSLSRFPLLLGAILCYALAIYEETVTDTTETIIAVAGAVVGSILLGAWLAMYVIETERRWQERKTPAPPAPEAERDRGV